MLFQSSVLRTVENIFVRDARESVPPQRYANILLLISFSTVSLRARRSSFLPPTPVPAAAPLCRGSRLLPVVTHKQSRMLFHQQPQKKIYLRQLAVAESAKGVTYLPLRCATRTANVWLIQTAATPSSGSPNRHPHPLPNETPIVWPEQVFAYSSLSSYAFHCINDDNNNKILFLLAVHITLSLRQWYVRVGGAWLGMTMTLFVHT